MTNELIGWGCVLSADTRKKLSVEFLNFSIKKKIYYLLLG
jgi:hypothetical protein